MEKRSRRQYVKSKNTRLRWTSELHQSFLIAIDKIGGLTKATPKLIVRMMNVEGVSISHVKSHLQMYRGAMNDINKRGVIIPEGRKQSCKKNDGNSDQQNDDSFHPPSNPTNGVHFEDVCTLKRLVMDPHHFSIALECNKRTKGGSSLDDNTSKENKSDDQHSILTSEEMEERQEADDCSLSLSLSLPEQRITSSSSSSKKLNECEKSDNGVNLDLSISRKCS